MVLNETLRTFNLTLNFYLNDSNADVIDYLYNRNDLVESEYGDFSIPFTNTFDTLSEVIINGTLNTDKLNYDSITSSIPYPFNASNEIDYIGYVPSFENNLLLFVLCFICIATIFGNVLVMAAVIREPYLHTVTNYFIASLAIADLIVGCLVMPFCVILEVTNGYWPFDQDWCDIWRSIDVLASTSSILNLCVISLDRLWAITKSMSYPDMFSTKNAGLFIAAVWLLSSLISFPAIAWWRLVAKEPPPPNQCLFTNDMGYLLFSSTVSFYAPLCVMLVNYFRIYNTAQIQNRSLRLGTKQVHGGSNISLTLRMHRGGGSNTDSGLENGSPRNEDINENSTIRVPSRHIKSFSLSRKISKLAKEQKAAKTLGIVMGVFILCWLPFFICNVLMGVCGEKCFTNPKLVFSIVTWLGWSNSAMNPVIYALWSREFRRAFTKLLCICCPRFIQRRHTYRSRFRQIVRDDYTYPQLHPASHPSMSPSTIQDINL